MYEFLEVSGGSMWPLLRAKDKVLIRRVSARSLRPGDVVAYRDRGRIVCHRLADKAEAGGRLELRCRGDADPRAAPEKVPEDRYEGKVVAIARGRSLLPVRSGSPALRALDRLVERLRLGGARFKGWIGCSHEKDIPSRRPR